MCRDRMWDRCARRAALSRLGKLGMFSRVVTECESDCPSTLSGTEVCPARWSFSARQTQSIQANRSSVILVSLVILRAVQGESLRTFGAKLIVCHRIGQALGLPSGHSRHQTRFA